MSCQVAIFAHVKKGHILIEKKTVISHSTGRLMRSEIKEPLALLIVRARYSKRNARPHEREAHLSARKAIRDSYAEFLHETISASIRALRSGVHAP